MRNQRGITLIALVITIIVLLILAGVSIAMLTGDNGILSNAREAQTRTAKKSNEEIVKLAVADVIADFYANNGTGTAKINEADLEGAITTTTTDYTVVADATASTTLAAGQVKVVPDADSGPTKLSVSFYGDSNTYEVTINGGAVNVTTGS